jgi:TRAP-type C4-dicarboxylate transport system substrate-binding protein
LLQDIATESVGYMRSLWDQAEATSRAAVQAAGVQINAVNMPAFRAVAEPFLRDWLNDPADMALYRSIRSLA